MRPRAVTGHRHCPLADTSASLAGLIPQARVTIYPDSAHGFLFQHHAEFAGDIDEFLTGPA